MPTIKGDGGVSKLMVALLLPVHPLLLVTVTVKVEAVVAGMVRVVAPVDQM